MARARKSPARKKISELSPAYRKRQESAARKAGMSLAQFRRSKERVRAARGHKQESAERKLRRERTKLIYGVGPEALRKLRQAAAEHAVASLNSVTTTHTVNPDTIQTGVAKLNAAGLRAIIEMGPQERRRLAGLNYAALIEERPEFENDDEWNPLWYG